MSITTKQAIEGTKNLVRGTASGLLKEPDGEGKQLEWLLEQRKNISIKYKQLEKELKDLDADIKPFLDTAISLGETKLGSYWTIQKGRGKFNKDRFESEAPETERIELTEIKGRLKEITDEYSDPVYYLKHARL